MGHAPGVPIAGALLLCGAFAAFPVRAEESCGSMVETVTRFRGRVTAVEPLGRSERPLTPVDPEPRYATSVSVLEVAGDASRLRPGESWDFGIHSPSRTFRSGPAVGAELDLELHALACDGSFRRFFGLAERGPADPEPFEGRLEVGRTYKARILWDRELGLRPEVRLAGPHHHAVGIEWTNPTGFPELPPSGRATAISFEVVERWTRQRGERQWITVYRCSILGVEGSR